jgi:hypothetical protein
MVTLLRVAMWPFWKVYHFYRWCVGPTAKGVLLDDYRHWKKTGEWSDKPPKWWPFRRWP